MHPPCPGSPTPEPPACNCQSLRQASRRVTQLYDAALAPLGLRTSQMSILARLARPVPWSIQSLADELVMDRTTLGRTLRPLERDGLLTAIPDPADRRSRALTLTPSGRVMLDRARPLWAEAQNRFEAAFGPQQAAALRGALHALVGTDFTGAPLR